MWIERWTGKARMSGLNTDRPIGEIDGAKMCAVISDETRTVDRCSRWTGETGGQ